MIEGKPVTFIRSAAFVAKVAGIDRPFTNVSALTTRGGNVCGTIRMSRAVTEAEIGELNEWNVVKDLRAVEIQIMNRDGKAIGDLAFKAIPVNYEIGPFNENVEEHLRETIELTVKL